MHHVVISPEVAVEKPGDGQHAIIGTLATRRKVMTLETADLDPETYWKRRRNLVEGKVHLSNLKEEFAREPSNYMVLNGAVADALLKKALDREAIVIQTGAGQIITRGGDLLRTDGPDDYVYLRDKACPECHRFLDDCPGHDRPQPQECPLCGKEQHEGECQASPPPEPPGHIQSFSSGLQPQPLNVLGAELRRHMDRQGVTSAEIETLTLGGDRADFIGFVVWVGRSERQSNRVLRVATRRGLKRHCQRYGRFRVVNGHEPDRASTGADGGVQRDERVRDCPRRRQFDGTN